MTSPIENKSRLAKTKQREMALEIVEAALRAIKTETVLRRQVSLKGDWLEVAGIKLKLSQYQRIGFFGIGKCALESAKFFEQLLKERLNGGVVIDVSKGKLKKISSFAGTHPLPSARNIVYTRKALAYLRSLYPAKDLLLAVVSGGGSSLFCLPEGIGLKEFRQLTLALQKSKANIYELNIIRKHLSGVKGGKLAKLIYPLKTICLVFSDVIGDDLSFIASGPLVRDQTTNQQAEAVLKKYNLWESYRQKIKGFSETVKQWRYFRSIDYCLVLNNLTALRAMAEKAKQLGLRPKILTDRLSCLNFNAFKVIKEQAKKFPEADLFLAGGETKVNIKGRGKGGRNLEAALASLLQLNKNELFLAFASDGIDNAEFAGGIGDWLTREKARKLGLVVEEYLENNDSYHFFKRTGDYLKTGPTGSNVADLMIYYRERN